MLLSAVCRTIKGVSHELYHILLLFRCLLQFLKLFDELIQGVEAILAAGHMGVIVQLAESCAESEEKQEELMQCLLRVLQQNSQHVFNQ